MKEFVDDYGKWEVEGKVKFLVEPSQEYIDKKMSENIEKSLEIEVAEPIDLNKKIEDLEKRIIALENK